MMNRQDQQSKLVGKVTPRAVRHGPKSSSSINKQVQRWQQKFAGRRILLEKRRLRRGLVPITKRIKRKL